MTDRAEPAIRTDLYGPAHPFVPPATFPEPWRTIFGGAADKAKTLLAEAFSGLRSGVEPPENLFALAPTGISLAPLVDATNAFLGTLNETQRQTTMLDIESIHWRGWHNMHPNIIRHGISMMDMDTTQREATFGVMREAFSAAGYENARGVMQLNEFVAEITGSTAEFGEWHYFMSIFGEPSATEPWGWQLDGHHLIVNCFVLGDQLVLTPQFSGSEPLVATSGKYAGVRVFDAEAATGLAFMKSLRSEQRAQATIGMTPPRDVLAGAQLDNLLLDYAGIRYNDLDASQQALLLDVIGVYVGRIRPGHDEVRMDEVRAQLGGTFFAWIGAVDDVSPFYYRIHSPVILIEFDHLPGIVYDNTEASRRHVHTMVRTPNGNDYGRDWLRRHYADHDHSHPHTPHRLGHE